MKGLEEEFEEYEQGEKDAVFQKRLVFDIAIIVYAVSKLVKDVVDYLNDDNSSGN